MMTTHVAWLGEARLTELWPGEQLVASGARHRSPFAPAGALASGEHLSIRLGKRELFTYPTASWLYVPPNTPDPVKFLARLDDVLLEHGPAVAAEQWTAMFGTSSSVTDNIAHVSVSIERHGSKGMELVAAVPNVIGMTPNDACVYLTAIGKLDQPLPAPTARALLAPSFSFGQSLAGLAERRTRAALASSLIHLNDAHQLELRGREAGAEHIVLSNGWRAKRDDVFDGYPNENRYSQSSGDSDSDWPVDHDGVRLVRTASPRWRVDSEDASDGTELVLPVVPLAEIAPDVSRLLNEVAASPATMLQADVRSRMWRTRHSDVSPVAVRLVEGVLQQYVPWPFPFKLRRAGEQQVSQETTWNAVVRAFKRLLVASIDTEPPDVAAHFLALIGQGRAPLSVWPIPLEGVWGFKIRTGDHEWLKGTLWMEPDVVDNLSAALVFKESGKRIECGAARCAIQKSHY